MAGMAITIKYRPRDNEQGDDEQCPLNSLLLGESEEMLEFGERIPGD